MNHSARAKFEPTAVLTAWATLTTTDKTADVKFKAGFNEWEEARTKSNLNVLGFDPPALADSPMQY